MCRHESLPSSSRPRLPLPPRTWSTRPSPAPTRSSATASRARLGRGVVQRTVTASANGLVRATLSAQGGDWDLAVFDRAHRPAASPARRRSAPPSSPRASPSLGQSLIVQACRRSGSDGQRAAERRGRSRCPAPTGDEDPARARRAADCPARAPRSTPPASTRPSTRAPGLQDVLAFGPADLLQAHAGRARLHGRHARRRRRRPRGAERRRAVRRRSRCRAAGPSYRHLRGLQRRHEGAGRAEPDARQADHARPHRRSRGAPVEGIEITRDVNAQRRQAGLPPDGRPPRARVAVGRDADGVGDRARQGATTPATTRDRRPARRKARVIVVPVVNADGFNLSREAPIDSPAAGRRPELRLQAQELPHRPDFATAGAGRVRRCRRTAHSASTRTATTAASGAAAARASTRRQRHLPRRRPVLRARDAERARARLRRAR